MTDLSPALPTNAIPLRGYNVVAVASGKGGVGKTWLSITLSHALARLGRRTLLFDGDLGLANVDIQLGLMPRNDLGAVMDGTLPLAAAAERFAEGGFDIIAGRSGSGSLANLTPARLGELRRDLVEVARSYDAVVVDLGAGVDRTVRHLAGPAGITLVVTNDEPTSLTDAYAFIKVTHAASPNADLRVVVNMASSVREGERTYGTILKACQNFLKFSPPLAGIIRRDPRVRDAIRNQSPLLLRSPGADAAGDVEAVARRLFAPQ
ncbi:MinD/ParA family protein [Arenibaculum sp.]|jgi:flagellar biosynthesis protein FlhG|uniref:MinD/ParA family protein n=1 Tax=Arenibaculum sp. TaxID=2865862 RepID=UPI002E161C7D|nr:MinD/ParA family protein [Arenibaculum sp.]